jgi:hypothetical protein
LPMPDDATPRTRRARADLVAYATPCQCMR